MSTQATGLKRITIEPVTRVEGHGKVTLLLDENNKIEQARLHIVEFRGFERFVQGRTWLVVTHRNSLLEMVDRIIVIDNGKLVADGPRDSVIQLLQQGKIGKVQ